MATNQPVNFDLHIRHRLDNGWFPVTARVTTTDQLVDGMAMLPVDDAATMDFLAALQVGLVDAAYPTDLPVIQGQEEIDVILHELADLVRRRDAEVVPLTHASLRTLQSALREAAARGQPFHILHVISHGALDPTGGRAQLFLENDRGRAQALDAPALADLLRPFDLKLVYLNGCDTAGERTSTRCRQPRPTLRPPT